MGISGRDNRRIQETKHRSDGSQRPEERHVPLYRSYGVKKKVYPLIEKLETYAVRLVALWVYGAFILVGSIGMIAFFIFFPELWVKLLIGVVAAVFLAVRLTRTLRIRRKFWRKLKRTCQKNRYSLKVLRPFHKGFRWSDRQADFRLQTGSTVYEMHFLTVKRYRSELLFDNKEKIRIKRLRLNNRFNLMMDFEAKEKEIPTNFPPISTVFESTKTVRGILINPVCREMSQKDRDGGMVTTGSGAQLYGYTIFTASGFLETIQRDTNERKPTSH